MKDWISDYLFRGIVVQNIFLLVNIGKTKAVCEFDPPVVPGRGTCSTDSAMMSALPLLDCSSTCLAEAACIAFSHNSVSNRCIRHTCLTTMVSNSNYAYYVKHCKQTTTTPETTTTTPETTTTTPETTTTTPETTTTTPETTTTTPETTTSTPETITTTTPETTTTTPETTTTTPETTTTTSGTTTTTPETTTTTPETTTTTPETTTTTPEITTSTPETTELSIVQPSRELSAMWTARMPDCVMDTDIVFFRSDVTLVACTAMCSSNSSCVAVFYDFVARSCQGHLYAYSPDSPGLRVKIGSVHFIRNY